MKLITRVYRWFFERDCVDYTKSYQESSDSGFSKWDIPSDRAQGVQKGIPGNQGSTGEKGVPGNQGYSSWATAYINTFGNLTHFDTSGYHNSRL